MIETAVQYLSSKIEIKPHVGVVLGSGLGAFAESLQHATVIPYSGIPGWPEATAIGHAGDLILGTIGGVPAVVMAGRSHLYEGITPYESTYGVRVLGALGVKTMVFTNAAGAVNVALKPGSLVLISDHINLQGSNPLAGPNDEALGPRFPDMSEAYALRCREIAREAGATLGIELPEGVYAAMLGPSYETPAEIRYLRTIGADLVGMSTVPEVIVANWLGIRCLAISCVTNMAAGVLPQKLNHEEVLATGAAVRDTLVRLLTAIVPKLA